MKVAAIIPAVALLGLISLSTLGFAQAYKCKAPGGGFIYQGLPCQSGGEQISTQPNGPTVDVQRQQKAISAYKQGRTPVEDIDPKTITVDQQAVYNGMMGSYPVVGMNLTQLDMALGKPAKVDVEEKDGYRLEVHLFRKSQPWYDVYVREGMVVRIRSSKVNKR